MRRRHVRKAISTLGEECFQETAQHSRTEPGTAETLKGGWRGWNSESKWENGHRMAGEKASRAGGRQQTIRDGEPEKKKESRGLQVFI